MVGNFFCLAYNWFSLDLLLTTTIDIVSHFSSTSAEMKIKKYLMLFLLLLIVTKIQGRLIGHVGKVVFSPTLHLSPHNHDGTDNDIESKPSKFPKFEDHGSRRCYKKVVMVDEMKFDTVETCNHSYDQESILKGES